MVGERAKRKVEDDMRMAAKKLLKKKGFDFNESAGVVAGQQTIGSIS